MKLQGKYEKINLNLTFDANVYGESYEDGELDYIHNWNYEENFFIENNINDIVNAIRSLIEDYLGYDWENLNGIQYYENTYNIYSTMTVNENNRELSESEYEEFKNGKNMYSLNFLINLRINDEDIEAVDLKNVINEINKTFEK